TGGQPGWAGNAREAASWESPPFSGFGPGMNRAEQATPAGSPHLSRYPVEVPLASAMPNSFRCQVKLHEVRTMFRRARLLPSRTRRRLGRSLALPNAGLL